MVSITRHPNLDLPVVDGHDKEEILTPRMAAKAILQCRPNSHPFQERTLSLDQAVKAGRSVARARPTRNNAIFDCRVLSRNHALLWYENGKFLLQDTKSSNGTFVNNQRLSKGSEESAPREVCSGDVIQFGVDVMENSRKGVNCPSVTHGCIIATLKLFMPDGQEAKASSFTSTGDGSESMSAQDLLHLKTCIQEAQHREHLIEAKLITLKQILKNTQEVAVNSWTAMIDEDRLLQRLENLEGQLMTYVKNYPEEASREEIKRIIEEKDRYETSAKESLERILKEKTETLVKCSDLERIVSNANSELLHMKQVAESSQNELEELLLKQAAQTLDLDELGEKLKATEEKLLESESSIASDKDELEKNQKLQDSVKEKLLIQIESLKAETDFTKEQLSSVKAKYENIKNGKLNMTVMYPAKEAILDDGEVEKNLQMFRSAVHSLQERLWQAQEELHQTQASLSQLRSESEDADEVSGKSTACRSQLQEELNEKKTKEGENQILISYLQSQLATLDMRLRDVDPEIPRIYEDFYEDNSMTLSKYKKALKDEDDDKNNKDDDNEKSFDSENEDTESDTTIMNEIADKNNMNDIGKFDSESLIYLKEDIIKIQEILQLAETSKSSAAEELKRIREEFGKASTSSITAAHEAANLHHQLAANEAVLMEKTRYVSTLQEVSGQLESSLDVIYSHISALSQRISKENEDTLNAKNQAQDFKNKLEEAEVLCKGSVEEAEKLRAKIDQLEMMKNFSCKTQTIDDQQESSQDNSSSSFNSLSTSTTASITARLEDLFTSEEQSDMIPQLKNEIEKLKTVYEELKAKETELCRKNDGDTPSSYFASPRDQNVTSGENDEMLLKVKDELRNVYEENKRLQEKLILNDGLFTDLNLQNKMSIPTWLLFLIAVSAAVGWDLLPNLS